MNNLRSQTDQNVAGFARTRLRSRAYREGAALGEPRALFDAARPSGSAGASPSHRAHRSLTASATNAGLSLVEMLVALTIIGVLTSMAVPSFQRAMDQSRADIAGANLRAIWSAERCYWLDNRSYTSSLSELETLGLIDPGIVSASSFYVYAIPAADAGGFTATATRTGSSRWSGQFTIDETGVVSGTVTASGEQAIEPGFQ